MNAVQIENAMVDAKELMRRRQVLTNCELQCGIEDGCTPQELADRNDDLADEYDSILEAEREEYDRAYRRHGSAMTLADELLTER